MLVIYSDNVSGGGDNVCNPTSTTMDLWVDGQKQNEILKINGEWLRVSEKVAKFFKWIAVVDKSLAKRMLIRYKLIWEYMQFRKSCDDDGVDLRLGDIMPNDTTVWGVLELAFIERIIGSDIWAHFSMSHNPRMIFVHLHSTSRTRFGWSDGEIIKPLSFWLEVQEHEAISAKTGNHCWVKPSTLRDGECVGGPNAGERIEHDGDCYKIHKAVFDNGEPVLDEHGFCRTAPLGEYRFIDGRWMWTE